MAKFLYCTTLFSIINLHAIASYPFKLLPRNYENNSLEPFIDSQTMDIHYNGHHKKYVEELNAALAEHPDLHSYSLMNLICSLQTVPEKIRTRIRHNGGGHENHTFFWNCMSPTKTAPGKELLILFTNHFGSFDGFKQKFNEAAKKVFGSGWVWLCFDPRKEKLIITSTPNQDSPYMYGLIPLLGLDVWEHAYYLKHQNKRASYIEAWWNVVNWSFVEENYQKARSCSGGKKIALKKKKKRD